jgi:hypothetical protein
MCQRKVYWAKNKKRKSAPAENRTRGPTMATLDFTTKPLVLMNDWLNFMIVNHRYIRWRKVHKSTPDKAQCMIADHSILPVLPIDSQQHYLGRTPCWNQFNLPVHIDSDTIQNICNAQPVCVLEQNQAVASNHQSFLVQVPGYRTD